MYFKSSLLFAPLLLLSMVLSAQVAKDATVAVTASLTTNPGSITLNWPNPAASSLVVFRHTKTSPPNIWFTLLNVSNSTQSTLVDNLISPGENYEYIVQRVVGNVTSYGYAHVAVNAPVVDNRGKLLFFVDSTLMGPLGNEVGQLKLDMMGDGWTIVPHIIGSGATVQSMKNLIVADYNADPGNVKMVFLLGALPVPYSGNTNWDGHADHQGAWPADSYYADVNGVWTDATVNNTSPSRAANDNVPGDGKFDQSTIPGNVELGVGRVDFRHLSPTTFGTSQIELYRRYLNKDHAWRMHEYTVENKAIVDDNFGYFNGEAFAANGFRNAYPLVGATNVVSGDFFQNTNPASYLLGMACGGGTYTSADGVGSSANFANDTVNVVFSMLFGSYHGDWDYESDPFMPAALASRGGILTCTWAGRPHVFYQALASGETVGYCNKETQNAVDNTGFFPSYGESGAHVSLLGDPSLRANVVAPPRDLVVVAQCGTVSLSWTAPSGGAPGGGYHVYRSPVRNGNYTRLTTSAVTGTTYTDLTAPDDTLYYQVRAVETVSNPAGGTYMNSSTGASAFLILSAGIAPELTINVGGIITCNQPEVNLTLSSSLPVSGNPQWQGTGGSTYTGTNITVNTAGIYTVTVTASNGCTATKVAVVSENTTAPTFNGTAGTITCTNPSVTIGAGALAGTVTWAGPNGFTSQESNPSVLEPGQYLATVTLAANGCTQTGSIIVPIDTFLPAITLPVIPTLTCITLCTNVILPTLPGYRIYVDGSLLQPGLPLGICMPGQHTIGIRSVNNGCQHNYPITVTQDVTPPGATATGGVMACNQSFQLQGSSPTPNAIFHWSGPGNFTSTQQNPLVTGTGTYDLVVTHPVTGCTSTASAVVANPSAPDVSAEGLTLNCTQTSGLLHGHSSTPGVTYFWTGPNGFMSTQQNPIPGGPGIYVVVVTAPNGCTNSASDTVSLDGNIPDLIATGAMLTCNQPAAIIEAQSTTPNVIYAWAGPNGFSSNLQNPTVSAAGNYVVIGTGTNGCSTSALAVVNHSPLLESVGFAGLPHCDGSYNLSAAPHGGLPPFQYAWSNGDTSQEIVLYLDSITLHLTVTDAAGCTVESIPLEIIPFMPITIDYTVVNEIDNFNNGGIYLSPTGTCQSFTYTWNTGAASSFIVNLTAGAYSVTVSCPETGCSETATFTVDSTTTGTEDPSFWKKLSLSPNPADRQAVLQIQFPELTNLQIKLINATGSVMINLPEISVQEASIPLDLSHCPSGIYTVLLSTRTGVATRKLVITR